ncbi:kelch-like protein 26 isoform X2 [Arctopsyche grandis]|uniref:kelch-like protein 26 isoform X2 n=1 Tax=Arctopsyche grandis TaxID=121162 RepID=UPI00406D7852
MCEKPESVHIFRNPNHKANTLDRIYTLYQQHRLCDVEIVLNNQRYQAHSVVLSALSEYLYLKLVDNVRTSSIKEIPINNLDNDATQRVIDYCYTGEIEFSYDTVLKVLRVAGEFQLDPVVKACCDYMSGIIDTKNCLGFHETVNLYGCTSLGDKVNNFILINYKKISQSEEFLKISAERLQRLLQMNLSVSSEDEIFNSVKAWVSHDMPNRKTHLISLLRLIKLPSLPDDVIFGEVQPLCEGVPNCQQLILSALQWKHLPNIRLNAAVNWNISRSPMSTIIAVGSWKDETVSKMEIYNPTEDTWSLFLDTNIRRRNAGYVLIGDELIAIGGQDDQIRTTVESVNLKTGKKVTQPSLQEARVSAAATLIGDVIYIFGGYNGSITTNSVEKWDPVTREWSFATPMKIGRQAFALAEIDNEIYIMGGWNNQLEANSTGYNNVDAFCPLTGKWRSCAPMNEARLWFSAATVGDKIYVLGGQRESDLFSSHKYKSVECYNKKTNSWSFISDLNSPRHGVTAGILGNDLVAVGGVDLATWKFTVVEKYDANLNKWKSLASLSENRENAYILSVPISWLERKITLN